MKKEDKIFHKTIDHINSLDIPQKDKDEIMNNIADLVYEISDFVLEKQADLEQRVEEIESYLAQEDEETQFEEFETMVKCPYCNKEVLVSVIENKNTEATCPNCNNVIELEWTYDKNNKNCKRNNNN